MAAYNSPASLVTPAGTITFNAATAPTLFHDPTQCAGLDMAPIRAPVDDKPVTDGGIVHRFWFGPRHVTLGGTMIFTSFSERETMGASLIAALTSIMRADGTYVWTPPGFTAHTITVRCEIPSSLTGGWSKNYLFGLVCADPTVTIS